MIDRRIVYVEEGSDRTSFGSELLRRLAPEHVTRVDDAQRLFKRPGQDFLRQKRRPRLILARKGPPYLYRGSERVASFGVDRPVYYNDPVRNCLYDCDYCFLQGMHRSANIIVNTNIEDYIAAVDQHLRDHGHLYLSISYLTDLLGFEADLGLVRRWMEIGRSRPALEIEVRTKSDGYRAIADMPPHPGVILTWSLSPEAIARNHEAGTAALQHRLLDARRAIDRGWRVRLCYDPIVVFAGWEAEYRRLVDTTMRRLPASGIEEVSFGVVRMHPDFHDRITAFRPAATLTDGIEPQGAVASYTDEVRAAVFAAMQAMLAEHLPVERIHPVHG